MLKKMFALLVLSMAIAAFSGCNSSSSDPMPVIPTLDGVYDVTFFATDTIRDNSSFMAFASDCAKGLEIGIFDANTSCQHVPAFEGEVAITNENGDTKMYSQIQLAQLTMAAFSATDMFQFTEYNAFKAKGLSGQGTGVKGRNLNPATGGLSEPAVEYATSPYEVTYDYNKNELKITMTLKDKKVSFLGAEIIVDAVTTVIAKKRTPVYTKLNERRYWDFNVNPTLAGVYDISFFGTNTMGIVVTNDCTKAIANGLAPTCVDAQNKVTKFQGEVAIDVDSFGFGTPTVKAQMEGGLVEASPADKYQYIAMDILSGKMSGNGMDVTNLDVATKQPAANAVEHMTSPYKVTQSSDGNEVTIEMTIKDKQIVIPGVPAPQTADVKALIKATKRSSTYTELENKLFWELNTPQ